jgi:feruloyl esterase
VKHIQPLLYQRSSTGPKGPPSSTALLTGLLTVILTGCATPAADTAKAPTGNAEAAKSACEALSTQAMLSDTTLKSRHVSAGARRPGNATSGDFLPGHCVVTGYIGARTGMDGKPYATGFELSLPDNWNGRFLYLGGGGNDGTLRDTSLSSSISIGTPSPLGQGFAVVSTDAGHQGQSGSFGLDPVARLDHAFDAHAKAATAAKALIGQHYGRAPNKSYFSGCSGGGRQGMMFSQRYPDMFDGITAGAPAMRVSSGATVAAMWNNIHLTAAAPKDAAGQPILSRAFSNADLTLVAKAINDRCDAADGLADGMVNHIQACQFDPAVLQCQGDKTATCLSPGQVGALKAVFGGPKNSKGLQLYAGQPWDPGLAAPGWRAWTLGNSTTAKPDSRYNFLMVDALVHEFFTPPDLGFDPLKFNFDTDPARMSWFSAIYDTYADDRLAAYQKRGGKLMLIHGMSDPIFSATDTLDYYHRLAKNNGGLERVQQFAKAVMVPGMSHCSGGPATDTFDSIQTMVDWVEKGVSPSAMAAVTGKASPDFPGRSRPLCMYPQYAKYKGSGNTEDAASFSCAMP